MSGPNIPIAAASSAGVLGFAVGTCKSSVVAVLPAVAASSLAVEDDVDEGVVMVEVVKREAIRPVIGLKTRAACANSWSSC